MFHQRTYALLAAAVLLLVATATGSAEAGKYLSGGPEAIEGEYVVVLEDEFIRGPRDPLSKGPSVAEFARSAELRHRAEVHRLYEAAVRGFAARMSEREARKLAADPRVALVEESRIYRATAVQTGAPWGLDRIDQRDLPLNGEYHYSNVAAGVNVYVLDTGIFVGHLDFGGRAAFARDVYGGDGHDCNGHGTHVAGIVAGATYGVAKGARVHNVKVLVCDQFGRGVGATADVIAGVDWVTANARLPAVVNMSLGGQVNSESGALELAIRNSTMRDWPRGIPYVVAAGNSAADACGFSPAREPMAITVGASDQSDRIAPFSNFGPCVQTNAPGVGIPSAWHTGPNAVRTGDGTSQAAPHVAGILALITQEDHQRSFTAKVSELFARATLGRLVGVSGNLNSLAYSRGDQESVNPAAAPRRGQWYNPGRSGNGIDFQRNSAGQYVLTWYTFNFLGLPRWYISDTRPLANGIWQADLYSSRRNASTGATTLTEVGKVRLEFLANHRALFRWDLDGQPGWDNVERFVHLVGGGTHTGLWYPPSEAGWGVSLAYEVLPGDDTYGLVFFYDRTQPTWAFGSLAGVPSNGAPMTLRSPDGGFNWLCPECRGGSTLPPESFFVGRAFLSLTGSSGSVTTDITLQPSGSTWNRTNIPMVRLAGP